ncbi:DUF1697 domain-containing protein [Qipengyuania vesicularis]|uniref:DUF1697 domain-containing protein n=1 Tax=Qipengyuania vesicularis TaxID=2867232 RepID=UPI001C87F5EF|nr:DUF1697 domain-containing protein [Qipengyuania vesicularis]MBX7526132.1 DUF1697 domain-containing protein [Qipengyuania vesicularis]
MTIRLALLGSINIGGNRIKMADLRKQMAARGFGAVETVAASGNVILSSEESETALSERLSAMIEEELGFVGFVVVRTIDEVRSAIEDNPFHGDGSDKMVHTIFLPHAPVEGGFEALLEAHRDRGAEKLALGDRVLYLDYVHGVGISDLTGRFIEKRLGCRGTARNMTSLKRILAKMENYA